MKNFKFSSSANGKVFRNGLYSTAILAAAIVLAVLINLLEGRDAGPVILEAPLIIRSTTAVSADRQ